MTTPVRDTGEMIRGMAPVLVPGEVAFVALSEAEPMANAAAARALIREAEAVTLVLPLAHTAVPPGALAMRQITLTVHSALDGVGLTAAVATALAEAGIPCNVVAGHHHDHVYVPSDSASAALDVLRARARL